MSDLYQSLWHYICEGLFYINILSILGIALLWWLISQVIVGYIYILFICLLPKVLPFTWLKCFIEKVTGICLRTVQIAEKDLTGKVCIVTGGASGIGKEISTVLVAYGASVIIADNNKEEGVITAFSINTLRGNTHGYAKYMYIDLANANTIQSFVKRFIYDYNRLDILINNAGIGLNNQISSDLSLSYVFQTNYIGTFLLTESLIPLLNATSGSRVVNTCSPIHRILGSNLKKIIKYAEIPSIQSYGASKAAILLYSLKLRRTALGLSQSPSTPSSERKIQLSTYHTWCTCVNPGSVITNIFPNKFPFNILKLFSFAFLNIKKGAQTTIYAALCPEEKATLYLSPYWLPGKGSWILDQYADYLSVYIGPYPAVPSLDDKASIAAEYLYDWTQAKINKLNMRGRTM
ncbi:oxidoreductase, short chain dehydrogenase/reductase family protein [Cryptosporidium serpentis]